MPKVEWDNLKIVEEFPVIDPNISSEVSKNNEHLDTIAAIIFKAYRRRLLSQQQTAENGSTGAV